jgi:hypothetical protein
VSGMPGKEFVNRIRVIVEQEIINRVRAAMLSPFESAGDPRLDPRTVGGFAGPPLRFQ